jgi:hypothetical protein
MDLATGMSGIDSQLVDNLLDALDMAMPDVAEGAGAAAAAAPTFADVMQATFQWNTAEAGSNMQLFFPHWQSQSPAGPQGLNSTSGMPCHPTPFAGQQQKQQQQLPPHSISPLPVADAAQNSCFSSAGARAAIPSPFAGIDASILQQPAAAAPSLPAAAAAAAATTANIAAAAAVDLPSTSQTATGSSAAQQQPQQQQQQQQQQHGQQQQQAPAKRGRPPKVEGAYSKGYSTILKYRQRKKEMVSSGCSVRSVSCEAILQAQVTAWRYANSLDPLLTSLLLLLSLVHRCPAWSRK